MTGRADPPPEWVELADRIRAFLPELSAAHAADVVAGLTPSARGRTRAHLLRHPDALVSGASDAPRSVQKLIAVLAQAGITGVRAPQCLRCGEERLLRRVVPGGRVCPPCEGILAGRGNIGVCVECGEVARRPSHQRCAPCQRAVVAATRTCSVCGKRAPWDPCLPCRPRPHVPCGLRGASAPVCARWPLGPVCKPCYRTARSHPGTCPGCGLIRVLVARRDGQRVCGPCAGHTDPYGCPRCGNPRSYKVRGLCDRCTLHDELDAVLGDDVNAPGGRYTRMHAALADCDQPRTALNWIRNARSAHLLAELVASGRPLTHAALDAMADGAGRGGAAAVDYLRGVLVTYGVLPERDELGPRIERHLARVVARHREHALLLRPYVRWSLLPRARGRPALAGGSRHRIRWAYTRINTAAAFLAFTTERGLTLADADQEDVDAWLVANPGTGYEVRDFVVWAARRGHSRPLVVPHRGKADPVGLDQDSAWELLHQCLTDADLPLDVRAAGAILLLFGQHLSRIAALPADAVTAVEAMPDARTEHAAAIVLDHVPILLPEPLARVLAGLAAQPPPSGWAANSPRRWLFPGSRAGTHASATVLSRRLAAHGIPVRPARTAALVHLAEDLPPAVLGPMLGMHIVTAVHWRRRANTDWTSYLQARAIACEDDRDRAGSDARPRS